MRQGFTSRNVTMDEEFESLKPFKPLRGFELDQKETKRQKFQTAYLLREFLFKITSLDELILKGNKLGDEGMNIISEAMTTNNCSLKKLDLTSVGMTHESFRSLLISMRTNHKLRHLIVDSNKLGTNSAFT